MLTPVALCVGCGCAGPPPLPVPPRPTQCVVRSPLPSPPLQVCPSGTSNLTATASTNTMTQHHNLACEPCHLGLHQPPPTVVKHYRHHCHHDSASQYLHRLTTATTVAQLSPAYHTSLPPTILVITHQCTACMLVCPPSMHARPQVGEAIRAQGCVGNLQSPPLHLMRHHHHLAPWLCHLHHSVPSPPQSRLAFKLIPPRESHTW